MSDMIGFLFGAMCGFTLAVVLFIECNMAGHHETDCHRPIGTVNTSKPPLGGTGVPKKYPVITRPEPIPYENEEKC